MQQTRRCASSVEEMVKQAESEAGSLQLRPDKTFRRVFEFFSLPFAFLA